MNKEKMVISEEKLQEILEKAPDIDEPGVIALAESGWTEKQILDWLDWLDD